MSNVISSAIFGVRRLEKAEKQTEAGKFGNTVSCATVAGGQLFKVGEYAAEKVTKLDGEIGKTAKTAVDALKKVSKEEAIIDYLGKGLKFASKTVNPLICVSSGVDVLTSEDKQSTLVTNATALSSMFFVEGQMKKVVDETTKQQALDKLLITAKNKALESKKLGKLTKNLLNFAENHNCKGKLLPVAHGLAFVTGSILAYNVGDKFGSLVAKGVKGKEEA